MAVERNFNKNNENCVEFLTGEHYAVCTYTNPKHKNRIRKLYEERGDEFKYFYENKDGSICAKFPLKWLKMNPGAKPGTESGYKRTPEQIEEFKNRMAKYRAANTEHQKNYKSQLIEKS